MARRLDMPHSTLLSLAGLLGLLCQVLTHAANPRTVVGESDARVYAVRYAPDGKSAIDVEVDEKGASIKLLEHDSFKTISTRRIDGEWYSAVIAPNGQWVALAGFNKLARIEIASGRRIDLALNTDCKDHKLYRDGHLFGIPAVAISNDSLLLAASAFRDSLDDQEAVIHIWSVQTGKVISTCKCKGDFVSGIPTVFSADGTLLRIQENFTSRLGEWDVRQSRFVRSIPLQKQDLLMASSRDGKLIALASMSEQGPSRIRLVETEHYTTVNTLVVDNHPFICLLEFTPGGTHLISCAMDDSAVHHEVRLWNLKNGKSLADTELDAPRLLCIACSPDGTQVLIGGADFDPNPKTRSVLKIWSPDPLSDRARTGAGFGAHGRVRFADRRDIIVAKLSVARKYCLAPVAGWLPTRVIVGQLLIPIVVACQPFPLSYPAILAPRLRLRV
jgi:WD40 repeat protein